MIGFGPHLMVDGYGSDKQILDSKEKLLDFLHTVPDKIGMTKIMEPYVIYYSSDKKLEDRGYSGFVIIAESHISIHTFPEKEYFSLDIFSCKQFDINLALEVVESFFLPKKMEFNITNRGTEFPRDLGRVRNIVEKDRSRYSF